MVYKRNKTLILERFTENLMEKYVLASHFEERKD